MLMDSSSPEIRIESEDIDRTVLDLTCIGDEIAATKALFMQFDPTNEGVGLALAMHEESNRGTKRAGLGTLDYMGDYINQLVGRILQQPDGTDISAFIRSSLKPYIVALHGSGDSGSAHLDVLAGITMEAFRQVQSFDTLSSSATSRLQETIGDNEAEQYKLMRILSRRVFNAEGVPEEDLEHSILQGMFAFQSLKGGERNLASTVASRLEQGRFDSFIASDLLHEANETEDDQGSLSELNDLIKLVSSVSGKDVGEVITRLSSTEELSRWPLHYRRLFETRRREYAQSLDQNYSIIKDYFSKEVLLPWNNSSKPLEEVLQSAIKASRASVAKLRSSHPADPNALRRARLEAIRHNANSRGPKKRQRQKRVGSTATNGVRADLGNREKKENPPQSESRSNKDNGRRNVEALPSGLSTSAILAALGRLEVVEVPGGNGDHRKVHRESIGKTTTVSKNLGPIALSKLLTQLGISHKEFLDKL